MVTWPFLWWNTCNAVRGCSKLTAGYVNKILFVTNYLHSIKDPFCFVACHGITLWQRTMEWQRKSNSTTISWQKYVLLLLKFRSYMQNHRSQICKIKTLVQAKNAYQRIKNNDTQFRVEQFGFSTLFCSQLWLPWVSQPASQPINRTTAFPNFRL